MREMGAVSVAVGVQEGLCFLLHAINRPLKVPRDQGGGPLLLLKEACKAVRQCVRGGNTQQPACRKPCESDVLKAAAYLALMHGQSMHPSLKSEHGKWRSP